MKSFVIRFLKTALSFHLFSIVATKTDSIAIFSKKLLDLEFALSDTIKTINEIGGF